LNGLSCPTGAPSSGLGAGFVTVLGFNLFGNAVRDALDPRLRRR
jgi:hypothetical protein